MATPRFEIAVGAINGSNAVFTVSQAYVANSTAVFINGLLMRRDLEDGWSESSPTIGQVTLTEAPKTGDVIQIFFLDTSPIPIEDFTPLSGAITDEEEDLLGRLVTESSLPIGVIE